MLAIGSASGYETCQMSCIQPAKARLGSRAAIGRVPPSHPKTSSTNLSKPNSISLSSLPWRGKARPAHDGSEASACFGEPGKWVPMVVSSGDGHEARRRKGGGPWADLILRADWNAE
ncbi:hypothetical protein BS50DRAFT_570519 [Corynespora cassiicola Philippines]|uniref:Uncharacterized protein n=1 Tax=Corynespora cassiicola Philippines TaxID=1448308 RepID=A0A2T2P0C6_CORCC|nr:hypothetical protein BS50DRAFT_570519 [Corynespora cassiicola Philippines]